MRYLYATTIFCSLLTTLDAVLYNVFTKTITINSKADIQTCPLKAALLSDTLGVLTKECIREAGTLTYQDWNKVIPSMEEQGALDYLTLTYIMYDEQMVPNSPSNGQYRKEKLTIARPLIIGIGGLFAGNMFLQPLYCKYTFECPGDHSVKTDYYETWLCKLLSNLPETIPSIKVPGHAQYWISLITSQSRFRHHEYTILSQKEISSTSAVISPLQEASSQSAQQKIKMQRFIVGIAALAGSALFTYNAKGLLARSLTGSVFGIAGVTSLFAATFPEEVAKIPVLNKCFSNN